MSDSFDPGAVRRALFLGFALFFAFVFVGGVMWGVGMALGLPRTSAFLVAVCLGPLVVAGGLLGWVFSMPLEKRQRLVGVKPSIPPGEHDQPIND